jgi:tetratricopeptide (TPR) repeat protein
MRTSIVVIASLFFVQLSFAQEAKLQQWKNVVSQGKKDTTTLIALDSLQAWYGGSRTDTGLYYLQQIKNIAEEVGNKKYESRTLGIISTKYFTEGQTAEALKLLYKALSLAEETKDTTNICGSYMNIGNSYKEYGDYFKANAIYKKGYEVAIKRNNELDLAIASANLGYSYEKLNQLDSAFYFEQQGYTIFSKIKKNIAASETYLGDLYYKLGNIKLAKAYYESALLRFLQTREKLFGSRFIVICNLGLANCYKTLNNPDSSFAFSKNGLIVAQNIKYLKGIRDAQKILSELFDEKHQIDSAFFYQKLYIATSDSLYNRDKSSALESLAFEQDLKEQERKTELEKQKEDRSHNLQLAITAIAILSGIILFLLLSRSILVSHKVVEFLSVIVLLVVFEFINLLIHPWLEKITHHSTVLMLLALVAIAALIVPFHHKLEHWTTNKLVEKNKAIRLANAKKTIEELETSGKIADSSK